MLAIGDVQTLWETECKVDWDWGFRHGRQYGRGHTGGMRQNEKKELTEEELQLGKRQRETPEAELKRARRDEETRVSSTPLPENAAA